MSAIFEDFDEAAGLLCDQDGNPNACDVFESEFPIREYLVPQLIELVVKELSTGVYRPEDGRNDANDNLPRIAGNRS